MFPKKNFVFKKSADDTSHAAPYIPLMHTRIKKPKGPKHLNNKKCESLWNIIIKLLVVVIRSIFCLSDINIPKNFGHIN